MPRPAAAAEVSDLRLRLDAPDGSPVEIRVRDTAGQARVSVHSADAHYNEALKDRVAELVGDIEKNGYRVEMTLAPARSSAEGDDASNRQRGDDQSSGDSPQQQHNSSGGSNQRQGRQQDQDQQAPWNNEFESAFAGAGTNFWSVGTKSHGRE
jgi:hypothetical protein